MELGRLKLKDGEIFSDERSLKEIMRFFVAAYKLPKGQKVLSHEYFIDTHKQSVIFRLVIQHKQKP